MKNKYDHIKVGKSLHHFVYPPATLPDTVGFKDGLKEVILEKLGELLAHCKELKNVRDKSFSFISKHTEPESVAEYFYATFASLEFAEYYIVQKWINYWLSLWYI